MLDIAKLPYDVVADLKVTLYNRQYSTKIVQLKSDPPNVFRVTFQNGDNKVILRAEKNSTFKMHWLFNLNGKEYDTYLSAPLTNIRIRIAELLTDKSEL